MKKFILLFVLVLTLATSCYRDVENIKQAAPQFLQDRGYTIVSYDGYEADLLGVAGGFVQYQVRDSAKFLYGLKICKWGKEYHIYSVRCLNAVSNITR